MKSNMIRAEHWAEKVRSAQAVKQALYVWKTSCENTHINITPTTKQIKLKLKTLSDFIMKCRFGSTLTTIATDSGLEFNSGLILPSISN